MEEKVLPEAGDQTTGQLRGAVRRAAIAADPEGADKRRDRAERHARVSLGGGCLRLDHTGRQ